MTIFVNPTASTNGSGSLVSPKNTWAGLTWTAGETYLQVEGTTYAGTIAPSSGGSSVAPITIGVCEAQTGNRVAGLGLAKIDATGQNYGVFLSSSVQYVNVCSLEIVGASVYGAVKDTASQSPSAEANCSFERLYVHDILNPGNTVKGIIVYGSGNRVLDNLVEDIGSGGIYATADGVVVSGNRIRRSMLDLAVFSGDCIHLVNCDAPMVEYNSCDHTQISAKAAIIHDGGGVGGVFRFNVCRMARYETANAQPPKCMNITSDGCDVYGNLVEEGEYGLWLQGEGNRAYANVITTSSPLSVAAAAIVGVSNRLYHNAIVGRGVGRGISNSSASYTSVEIVNNIVVGFAVGITYPNSGTLEAGNILYGCDTNFTDTGGTTKPGAASDVFATPQFLDALRPWLGLASTSPCRGAGAYVQGARDRFSRRYVERNIGPWASLGRS